MGLVHGADLTFVLFTVAMTILSTGMLLLIHGLDKYATFLVLCRLKLESCFIKLVTSLRIGRLCGESCSIAFIALFP